MNSLTCDVSNWVLGLRIDVSSLPKGLLKELAKAFSSVMESHSDVDPHVLKQCASFISSKPLEALKSAAISEDVFDEDEVIFIKTVKTNNPNMTGSRVHPKKVRLSLRMPKLTRIVAHPQNQVVVQN